MPAPNIHTLGELRDSGYVYRPIKAELRENLVRRLQRSEPILPGLVGYENTVVPELINAILAGHDILLLGLRGQAKTRILRSLPGLLDEYIPVVAEAEIWDDPLAPQLAATRRQIEQRGNDTPIGWIPREDRYREKLATPDVTIADLIGEIDLVKHAEGRYLADESTVHFGLVPRSNRAIFAINELPDLAPRIQVGLFNVLEERDVQIRGFPVRLNLDVLLVFSANPEDYTNRGRIVTPLKDRIGSVIRTHYPHSLDEAMRISRENARINRPTGQPQLDLPLPVHQTLEEFVRMARKSPHVNQQSGVSVRASITALEVLVASAERRALLCREPAIVPRVSDLDNVRAALRGKMELMLADDDAAEDKLIRALLGEALKSVGEQYIELENAETVIAQFAGGKVNIEVGDDVPAAAVVEHAAAIKGLTPLAESVLKQAAGAKSGGKAAERGDVALPRELLPLHLASAIEFVLEVLHVNNKLSKFTYRQRTFYKR